jgi:dihydroneopterin aldolase
VWAARESRIGLLAIEQAAWAFCDGDPRFGVVASRTELDWALKTGRLSVWAPAHMVVAAPLRPAPDASRPGALAAWLAEELGAEMLVLVGDAPVGTALPVHRLATPKDLATLG